MSLYCHVNLYRCCYSSNIYFIYINWLYTLLKGIFVSTIITKNQVFSFILYNVKKKRTKNFYFFIFFLFFIFYFFFCFEIFWYSLSLCLCSSDIFLYLFLPYSLFLSFFFVRQFRILVSWLFFLSFFVVFIIFVSLFW